jgi:hypothetical protein
MRFIRQASTIGALRRRFHRDQTFAHGERITGPAATHVGPNENMALRFGVYRANRFPNRATFCGLTILWGKNAGHYAELSDMEASWLVFSRFAVGKGAS